MQSNQFGGRETALDPGMPSPQSFHLNTDFCHSTNSFLEDSVLPPLGRTELMSLSR